MGLLQVGGELQNIVGDGIVVDASRVRMNDSNGEASTLDEVVGALQTAGGTAGSDISGLKSDVGTLQSDMGAVKTTLEKIGTAFVFRGSVASKDALPEASGERQGHVYNISAGEEKGANYVCILDKDTGKYAWDKLSEDIAKADLDDYYTKSETTSAISTAKGEATEYTDNAIGEIMPMLMNSVSVVCTVSPSAAFVGDKVDVTVSGTCNVSATLTLMNVTDGVEVKKEGGVTRLGATVADVAKKTSFRTDASVKGNGKNSSQATVNFYYPIYGMLSALNSADLLNTMKKSVGQLKGDNIVNSTNSGTDYSMANVDKLVLYGPWANPNGKSLPIQYREGSRFYLVCHKSVSMNYGNVKLPSGFGIGFDAAVEIEGTEYKYYRTSDAFGQRGETTLAIGS